MCRIQVYSQVLILKLVPTLARLNKTDLANVLFKLFFFFFVRIPCSGVNLAIPKFGMQCLFIAEVLIGLLRTRVLNKILILFSTVQ